MKDYAKRSDRWRRLSWFGWRRRASVASKVIGLGSVVIVLTIAMATSIEIRRYDAELVDAARELRTLDLLLAEEAGRSLQNVALVLDNVADQVRAEGVTSADTFVERMATKSIYDALRARVAGVPQLDAVTMISANGKLINFSRSWPIPDVDLNDRDYFRYLKNSTTEKTFLSEPVINRGSGTRTIYLARRFDAPDGTFVGLLLGAIELDHFEQFYASLHLDPGNFIALWRQDGVLLARYPPAEIGQRMPPDAITSPATSWRGVPGVFEKSWSMGNDAPETRVVASQAAIGFPLQVNIGRSKAVILADWTREVAAVGSAVALAVLCVGVLMWALIRRFHAYEAVTTAAKERAAAIVARQEAEDALRQAQKMEAVGQLTGGVAHDFNNLLTVIRSSVDLLRRPHLADERRIRYVDAISDATDRAAKLTAQLLAFARRQALKPEVFDAVENVAAVATLVERLAGSGVRVETVLPDGACYIDADPNQFDTSIVNMAVNARDAMDGGGCLTIAVEVTDAIPAGRTHPLVQGSFVAVSVRDTGIGIAPDLLDRVFDPFFTTKKVGEGTGLGLSQVFGFAKQSGGEVSVESTQGCGTTFTLYLPRADPQHITSKPVKEPPATDFGGRGARVLVVEDNEQVGRSAVLTLTDLGYETVWAGSAEEALSEIQAGRDDFDIVFSDVVMRGMSGFTMAQTLRRSFHDLPIVLASGYSQALAEQGVDGFPFLQKPYSREDLSRALYEARSSSTMRQSTERATEPLMRR